MQMTEFTRIANILLTKVLPMALGALKMILTTQDNVKVDENGFHNSVSIDIMTHAPNNARGIEGTKRESEWATASSRRNEKRNQRK